jgi:hypothetical protein
MRYEAGFMLLTSLFFYGRVVTKGRRKKEFPISPPKVRFTDGKRRLDKEAKVMQAMKEKAHALKGRLLYDELR